MSKNKKSKKKNGPIEEPVQSVPEQVLPCVQVYLQLLSQDIRLLDLNKLMLQQYIKNCCLNRVVRQDDMIQIQVYGKQEPFKVVKCLPCPPQEQSTQQIPAYILKSNTLFNILTIEEQPLNQRTLHNKEQGQAKRVQMVGMDKEIQEVVNLVRLSFQRQVQYEDIKLKGIVVYGPAGCGKTSLLKKSQEVLTEVTFLQVRLKDILSKYQGESEQKIREIFQEAKQVQPCVIMMDDLHDLVDQKALGTQTALSLAKSLEQELDGIEPETRVMVLAACLSLDTLPESLRKENRMDKSVRIMLPSQELRKEVLSFYLQKGPHSISLQQIKEINMSLNGFTMADVKLLVRESVVSALQSQGAEYTVTRSDLEKSLSAVRPSGLKDILLEVPRVLWSDIGGYEQVKREVRQVVETPLAHPEAFTRLGITSAKGVLLYGPPGCSKTMIAKAVATESKLNFMAIKGPELFSKYVGDSEKAIRELFSRARLCSPCVIFFDEIDAIAGERGEGSDVNQRVLTQLLTEMNGIETLQGVIVIAATNRPDILDKALIRPERFDKLIYIPPPDAQGRMAIWQGLLRKVPTDKQEIGEKELQELVNETEGFSGAEIVLVAREAALMAIDRDIQVQTVAKSDFKAAMKKVTPRITQQLLNYYADFQRGNKFM